ncbi:hypothetical protein [Rhizobium hainanense]|uniref:Protease inhibitor Inh n=1 Tax=Rhizobium hainanense TaxID=52131 RepID=A0A1C3WKK2_9HYPH|nr:hypothetical protein [Rhizobium hainanense]SCB40480.1 hypothetical protein GA0061100_12515 [Rhizobium hainanense]
MNRRLGKILAGALLLAMSGHSVLALDGVALSLKLTAKDAEHDPDGVWSDRDLDNIRQTFGPPDIYTARITTSNGTWLLSQTNGDCNMQGMCTAQLVLIEPGKAPKLMANPQMPLGGTAVLSPDFKKIKTSEIGENGRPLAGSYDVEPVK